MSCDPPLKWVGGKRQLLPHLLPLVTESVKRGKARYFEPFVGGGALFFAVQPPRAVLNDRNVDLMDVYGALRPAHVETLIRRLQRYVTDHRARGEAFYYQTRATQPKTMIERAARAIYLNRTCFNGLWRTNKAGFFNVPFGRYTNPTICDEERLRACSAALKKGVVLTNHDFEVIAENAQRGDFVYFDPPYVPLSATSSFTGYGKDGFTPDDQRRLRDLALRLKQRSVTVVLSNSIAARDLYVNADVAFRVQEVDARRAMNSVASKRGAVKEVIIT